MKLQLQRAHEQGIYCVEIPESLDLNFISNNQEFFVYVNEDYSKKVCVKTLMDGRALLIGDNVIRFQKKITKLKDDDYLVCVDSGYGLTQNKIKIKRKLPVEPKFSKKEKTLKEVVSPMTGKIVAVSVKENDVVDSGNVLVIVEAMKMENKILCEQNRKIKKVYVSVGQNVKLGDVLVSFCE